MSQLKSILFIQLFFIFAATVSADEADYQAEIRYATFNQDYNNNDEIDGSLLYLDLYLEKVKPTNQPLAEANFLQRVSHFLIAFTDISGVLYSGSTRNDADAEQMLLQYTHLQKDSPLIFRVSHSEGKTNYHPQGFTPYKIKSVSNRLRVGSYIAQNTAWFIDYAKGDSTYSPAGYASNDYNTTSIVVNGKHLSLSADGTAIGIEASIGTFELNRSTRSDEKNTILTLSGDYYFTNRYSAGASLVNISGDDNGDKGQEIAINGQLFLTPRFHVFAELAKFSGEGQSVDYDSMLLSGAFRF